MKRYLPGRQVEEECFWQARLYRLKGVDAFGILGVIQCGRSVVDHLRIAGYRNTGCERPTKAGDPVGISSLDPHITHFAFQRKRENLLLPFPH